MASNRAGSSRAATAWAMIFAALALVAIVALFLGHKQKTLPERLQLAVDSQSVLLSEASELAARAAQGHPLAYESLQDLRERFARNAAEMSSLETLAGAPGAVPPALLEFTEELVPRFQEFGEELDKTIATRTEVAQVAPAIRMARDGLPALTEGLDQLALKLRESLAPAAQLYATAHAATLSGVIDRELWALGLANTSEEGSAGELEGRISEFADLLEGLMNGHVGGVLQPVSPGATRDRLEALLADSAEMREGLATISDAAADMYAVAGQAGNLRRMAGPLQEQLSAFDESLSAHAKPALMIWNAGLVMAGLAVLALLLMLLQIHRDNQRQIRAVQEANQKSQNAIMRLLDEMSTLAEGDLTVEATVDEEITGAIADSVNYAVEQMRKLVQTINLSSVRVENTARQTQTTTKELSDSSRDQAQQIERVSDSIEELNRSIDKVAQNAEDSAEVAEVSVSLAQKGVQTVHGTMEGMDQIRERIQDTSKRIKRLGESSQEIGDIVSLITDIADQTNILALNAAIQASAAGEGGRGFAVVADEVQRLAERSSNASKQIEALVKTIQADTNEAVHSMEQSTMYVVQGANLAEDSGRALEEIETVSNRLASLVNDISGEAQEQAILSDKVTSLMSAIQRITGQTVAATNDTAMAVGELVEQSRYLQQSVEGFKLSDELEDMDVDLLGMDTEETSIDTMDDASDEADGQALSG